MAEPSAAQVETTHGPSVRFPAVLHLAEGKAFWLVLSVILVLSVVLRLPGLSERSLWLDEAYSAWFSALPLGELWNDAPRYETHPPAYYALLKGWVMLFGPGEAAIRSLSLIASTTTVLVVSLAGRILRLGATGDRAALMGALLLAINPASIVYAQEARPYALQTLAAAGAILSGLCLIDAFRAAPRAPGLREIVVAVFALALCAGTMLWLHNTSVFIAFGLWSGLGLAILTGPREGRRSRLAAAIAAGLLALAIWSPFLPLLLEQGRGVAATAFWVRAEMRDLWSAWTLVAGGMQLLLPVLFSAALGLLVVRRRSPLAALHITGILVLPIAVVLAIHFTIRPIFVDRLFVWLAPVVTMLAAIGLLHGPAAASIRLALAGLIVGFSLTTGGRRPAEEDWRGLVATIAAEAQPGDLLVALPSEIDPAIGYYARRHPAFPRTVYVPGPFPYRAPDRIYIGNLGAPKVEPEDAAALKPALAGAGRVWLVSRRSDLYDPGGMIRQVIARDRRPVASIAAGAIAVELFD